MCGITGYFRAMHQGEFLDGSHALSLMTNSLKHRGPDDSGCWLGSNGMVGLGHRRLSIVDLSPAGHQPMHSNNGRYVIVFNGEIYNHLKLRDALGSETSTSFDWKGHSDTETLLAGFEVWGVENTINRCVGMFAIAIWDMQSETLTLVRDRLGEKPLYYGWLGDTFVFGSELKALRNHPLWCSEIDRDSLSLYLRFNYIPAPYSIYRGINKLLPGTALTVFSGSKEVVLNQYWSMVEVARSGVANPFLGGEEDAVAALEDVLTRAVGLQMVSDVPLGAFLSGGMDSSVVVALMQKQSSKPVKTFTIGFSEQGYDEAVYAKSVAKHLGTDHVELYVSAEKAMQVIPLLPKLYDEPFADSSQIPTFLVSKLAKEKVTVSLSGDGGDELFCGYNRYQLSKRWGGVKRLPIPLRRVIAHGIKAISPDAWNRFFDVLPNSLNGYSLIGEKLHKAATILEGEDNNLYSSVITVWSDSDNPMKLGFQTDATDIKLRLNFPGFDGIQQMMLSDMLNYLPDDILVKVDRAAMGVSLETRVPFLDHRVVEFAWSLPHNFKLRDGQTKWILREILYKYVPQNLIERPKMGFGIPLGEWLRGPLRDWAEALIDASRLEREGYFYPAPIRKKWEEHLSGRRNWSYQLWGILMFQAWLEANEL